jgi:peptide/nickel transport system permease protein
MTAESLPADGLAPPAPDRPRLLRWLADFRHFALSSKLSLVGVTLVLLVLVAAVLGGRLTPYPPDAISLLQRLKPPSPSHLFGTDDYGRDLFSRVLAGAAISIEVAAIVISLSVVIGTFLGAIAGLLGGWVDEGIMRLTDLFLAFPALILAAAIAATWGGSLTTTIAALATVYWPWYARLVRGQVLSLREREFVTAARVMGAGPIDITRTHLLPNVLPYVILQVSLDIGYVILSTSALSFLGLGAQPPTPEWGAMMTDARGYVRAAWWFPTFPGLALALTVLGFNLVGDALRDWLDPRTRR